MDITTYRYELVTLLITDITTKKLIISSDDFPLSTTFRAKRNAERCFFMDFALCIPGLKNLYLENNLVKNFGTLLTS